MMSTMEQTKVSTQVYRVYIKAAPQAVWDAITKPEWTARYGYGGRMEYDLRPGGAIRGYTSEAMKQGGAAQGMPVPDLAIEGEVVEADPPRKLVLQWHMVMDPATTADRFTRLTYEISQAQEGAQTAIPRPAILLGSHPITEASSSKNRCSIPGTRNPKSQ